MHTETADYGGDLTTATGNIASRYALSVNVMLSTPDNANHP